jgi:hypothetical protein
MIFRVVEDEHEHDWTTTGTKWPAPGAESVVRTTILDDSTATKRTAQHWAPEIGSKIGSGVWMWLEVGL